MKYLTSRPAIFILSIVSGESMRGALILKRRIYANDIHPTILSFFSHLSFYGSSQAVELIFNGASVPVTADNREHFVQLYVSFLLSDSVASVFEAFQQGFDCVCGGEVLSLLTPDELEQIICGR